MPLRVCKQHTKSGHQLSMGSRWVPHEAEAYALPAPVGTYALSALAREVVDAVGGAWGPVVSHARLPRRICRITNPRDDGLWDQTEFALSNLAFFTWLRDAHPGVFEDIAYTTNSLSSIPAFGFPGDPHEAKEMLTALEYVDEFVNQTDEYPIDP